MKISIIVAISNNHAIGIDNQLPWHLPTDLQYFKSLTLNHSIIMGRNTFESIGRALPKRENIVITRDISFQAKDIIIVHSIEESLEYCRKRNDKEIFIIGGENIYKQCISKADCMYITRVDVHIENATAFFPEPDKNQWLLVNEVKHKKDERNAYDFTFQTYEKKKSD